MQEYELPEVVVKEQRRPRPVHYIRGSSILRYFVKVRKECAVSSVDDSLLSTKT